jgi:teichuronic acid biosynthesis glycosyltransferase TuaG
MSQEYIPGLVSVIIPSYNRYDSLLKAIDSVCEQSYPHKEIIVIDDGSSDERYKTLAEDTRITLITLPMNLRKKYNTPFIACQGLTRNEGLNVARGEWVAFLDDDDYWNNSDKLTIQISKMKEYNIGFCSTNMITRAGIHDSRSSQIFTHKDLLQANPLACSTVIVRREYIDRVGGFRLTHSEDYDCWKRIIEFSHVLYLDIVTVHYDIDSVKCYRTGQ